jgi:hypothetical protein
MICTARTLALVFPALLAAPLAAQQYGKVLTLKKQTKISDIIAKPDAYDGKLVQVRGTIVDVCSHMGCWIQISGDKRFQSILFKVEDGVISFPMEVKGKEVVAEGIIAKLAAKAEEENCEEDGKDAAPKVRINGLGAVAK